MRTMTRASPRRLNPPTSKATEVTQPTTTQANCSPNSNKAAIQRIKSLASQLKTS